MGLGEAITHVGSQTLSSLHRDTARRSHGQGDHLGSGLAGCLHSFRIGCIHSAVSQLHLSIQLFRSHLHQAVVLLQLGFICRFASLLIELHQVGELRVQGLGLVEILIGLVERSLTSFNLFRFDGRLGKLCLGSANLLFQNGLRVRVSGLSQHVLEIDQSVFVFLTRCRANGINSRLGTIPNRLEVLQHTVGLLKVGLPDLRSSCFLGTITDERLHTLVQVEGRAIRIQERGDITRLDGGVHDLFLSGGIFHTLFESTCHAARFFHGLHTTGNTTACQGTCSSTLVDVFSRGRVALDVLLHGSLVALGCKLTERTCHSVLTHTERGTIHSQVSDTLECLLQTFT